MSLIKLHRSYGPLDSKKYDDGFVYIESTQITSINIVLKPPTWRTIACRYTRVFMKDGMQYSVLETPDEISKLMNPTPTSESKPQKLKRIFDV